MLPRVPRAAMGCSQPARCLDGPHRAPLPPPLQTVHHLFPGVSHAHYPALAPIIEQTAAEYGIGYKKSGNIWQALGAHFRYLKQLGQP